MNQQMFEMLGRLARKRLTTDGFCRNMLIVDNQHRLPKDHEPSKANFMESNNARTLA